MQRWIQVKKSYEDHLCTVQKEKIQRLYEELSILGELNLKKKELVLRRKKIENNILSKILPDCMICWLPWLKSPCPGKTAIVAPPFNGICSKCLTPFPFRLCWGKFVWTWSSFTFELDPHFLFVPRFRPCLLRSCLSWCSANKSASSVLSLVCFVRDACLQLPFEELLGNMLSFSDISLFWVVDTNMQKKIM